MNLIEHKVKLFEKEPIKTEEFAYRLLKKNPIGANVNYLAVPWSVLLNHGGKRPRYHNLDNGFTVCQHIRYVEIVPLLKRIGIDTLFTPHVHKKFSGIRILPFPHISVNCGDPLKKDIFYSFIGAPTHKTRNVLFNLKSKKKNVLIKKRSSWHFEKVSEKYTKEYINILQRSRYSLCPRGTGASTIRFWESLRSGSIPVLISDAMKLPENFNWDNCIVRIKEKDTSNVENILLDINKDDEDEMRSKCLEAFEMFSNKNFVSYIRHIYEDTK